MANQDPQEVEQGQQEQNQQKQGGGGKKDKNVLLDYTLYEEGNYAQFLIHNQDKKIATFLEQNGGRYNASNGVTIAIVPGHFPEWAFSTGLIYLDGTDGECYGRIDSTELPAHRIDIKRKAIAGFKAALQEFTDLVRLVSQTEDCSVQQFRIKL